MSDWIVVAMDYRGDAEEWQDYCRKIVKLRALAARNVRSIVLQKNDFEFEVNDEKLPGKLVGVEMNGGQLGPGVLPAYSKS